MVALAVDPPGGAVVLHRRAWTHDDLSGAAIAIGALSGRPRRVALRGGGACGRRPGQRHRQAGVLRFLVRLDRQPLAAGDRHFHRRRRAGVRAGDPRQARSADPARLRALGRRRAPLARRGACRRACRSPAARRFWQLFTAHARCAIPTASRHESDYDRLLAETRDEGAKPEQRLGHAGRRRPRRSGIADAARGARAAIGRRHPDRRSGGAGDPRFRAPRGEEDDGRQDRLRAVLQAGRDQRADGVAGEGRQARGAAQGRRSDDLRPRRRGDRGLPRRRHRGRGGARHQRRAGRGQPARRVAHATASSRGACNT